MAHDNIIYQGDFYKLNEARKLFIGSKSDSWKFKYIIFVIKDNVPVLELHKKKPKPSKKSDKTLTDLYKLPTFKVEKLRNARGRSFVCEITCPSFHLFLSADEEKEIDILVFLLQTQLRLKDEIRDDVVRVVPENSDCQKKIGAKGSNCLLHISPWGITLVLERSRCLLAQWPLKSIRYYEASGAGHFTIEAGRVAPMGEGVFGFQTLVGEDDVAYDKVDNYIVNTLDRVKPNQRGTKEEIEDYIREHDYLHALAAVSVAASMHREVRKALKMCWDIGRSTETFSDAVLEPRGNASAESSVRNSSSSTHTSSLSVTLDRHNMSDSASSKSDHSPTDSRRSSVQTENKSRPPKPKSQNGGVPRRSRRRDHSLPRKVDVVTDDTHVPSSPRTSAHRGRPSSSENCNQDLPPRSHPLTSPSSPGGQHLPPRRHSNPSNVLHQVSNPDAAVFFNPPTPHNPHPYVNQQQQQQQQHHTEFYNLNSPNLKVRKCRSPVVTPHRNKVGRAELLLSVDQSGVRTPTLPSSSPQPGGDGVHGFGRWDLPSSSSSSLATTTGHMTDEEHRETQDYLDAVAKASQQKYGHNSIDRTWAKMKRGGGNAADGGPLSPGYINTFPPTGYVNIQKLASMEENAATTTDSANAHKRQNSLDTPPSMASRQNSRTSQGDPTTLSPPTVRHSRQRSAPVEGSVSSVGSLTASNQSYLQPSGDDRSSVALSSEIQGDDSEIGMRGKQHRQNSEGIASEAASSSNRLMSQLSGFSTFDQVDGPVAEWLISASCEDLSDHMRNVIYDDDISNNNNEDKGKVRHGENGDAKEEQQDDENTYEEIQSDKEDDKSDHNSSTASASASNDKPPLPFTGLKKFQNKVDISNSHRDRSKSFGYVNHDQVSSSSSGAKPQSSAPSAHLIRKMVAARAKQDSTLRKSLSNPNFLNLGSKEHLFNLKPSSPSTSAGLGGNSGEGLHVSAKQKSRSFGSLFPAIKKALSRESLGRSRSTTPERRSSFIFRRRASEHEVRRRSSVHSAGEMTIKGIRMTERSRSFRRVRGAKSVEVLSSSRSGDGDNGEVGDGNRLSTATNLSSPPAMLTSDTTSTTAAHQSASNRVNSVAGKTSNSSLSKTRSSTGFRDVQAENAAEDPPHASSNRDAVKATASSDFVKKSATLPSSLSSSPSSKTPSSFTSNIQVNLSNSSSGLASPSSSSSLPALSQKASSSQLSSPPHPRHDHLPPPPLPARKPRTKELAAQNGALSLSTSSTNVVPSKLNQNVPSPSRSSNYMNSSSIRHQEKGVRDATAATYKERQQPSSSTSRHVPRSKRRVSDKNDESTNVQEFGEGGESLSSKSKLPVDSARPKSGRNNVGSGSSSSATGESSGKSRSSTKSRSYKIATKS